MPLSNLPEDYLYDKIPDGVVAEDERRLLQALVGGYQDRLCDLRYYTGRVLDFFNPDKSAPDTAEDPPTYEVVFKAEYTSKSTVRVVDIQDNTPDNVLIVNYRNTQGTQSSVEVPVTEGAPSREVSYLVEQWAAAQASIDPSKVLYVEDPLRTWISQAIGVQAARITKITLQADPHRYITVDTLTRLAQSLGANLYTTELRVSDDDPEAAAKTRKIRQEILEGYFPRLKIKGTIKSFEVLGRDLGFDDIRVTPLWQRVSPRYPVDIGSEANNDDFAAFPEIYPSASLPDTSIAGYDPLVFNDGPAYPWNSRPLSADPSSEDYIIDSVNQRNPYVSLVQVGAEVRLPTPGVYILDGGGYSSKARANLSGSGLEAVALVDGEDFNGMKVVVVGTTVPVFDASGSVTSYGTYAAMEINSQLSAIKYRSSFYDLALSVSAERFNERYGTILVQDNPDIEFIDTGTLCAFGQKPIGGGVNPQTLSGTYTYGGTVGTVERSPVDFRTPQIDTEKLQSVSLRVKGELEVLRPATRYPRKSSIGLSYEDEAIYAPYVATAELFTVGTLTAFSGTVPNPPASGRESLVSYSDAAEESPTRNYVTALFDGTESVAEHKPLFYAYSGTEAFSLTVEDSVDGEFQTLKGTLPWGGRVQGEYEAANRAYNLTTVGVPSYVKVRAMWDLTSSGVIRSEPTLQEKDDGSVDYTDRPEDELGEASMLSFADTFPWRRDVVLSGERVSNDFYEPGNNEDVRLVAPEMKVFDDGNVPHSVVIKDERVSPPTFALVEDTAFSGKQTPSLYAPGNVGLCYHDSLTGDFSAYFSSYVFGRDPSNGYYYTFTPVSGRPLPRIKVGDTLEISAGSAMFDGTVKVSRVERRSNGDLRIYGDVYGGSGASIVGNTLQEGDVLHTEEGLAYHAGIVGGVLVADPDAYRSRAYDKNSGWFPFSEYPQDSLDVTDASAYALTTGEKVSGLFFSNYPTTDRVWDADRGWVLRVNPKPEDSDTLTVDKDRDLGSECSVSFYIKPTELVGSDPSLIIRYSWLHVYLKPESANTFRIVVRTENRDRLLSAPVQTSVLNSADFQFVSVVRDGDRVSVGAATHDETLSVQDTRIIPGRRETQPEYQYIEEFKQSGSARDFVAELSRRDIRDAFDVNVVSGGIGENWTRVDSLDGQPQDAKVYVAERFGKGGVGARWRIRFGDGIDRGSAVPQGSTITVAYSVSDSVLTIGARESTYLLSDLRIFSEAKSFDLLSDVKSPRITPTAVRYGKTSYASGRRASRFTLRYLKSGRAFPYKSTVEANRDPSQSVVIRYGADAEYKGKTEYEEVGIGGGVDQPPVRQLGLTGLDTRYGEYVWSGTHRALPGTNAVWGTPGTYPRVDVGLVDYATGRTLTSVDTGNANPWPPKSVLTNPARRRIYAKGSDFTFEVALRSQNNDVFLNAAPVKRERTSSVQDDIRDALNVGYGADYTFEGTWSPVVAYAAHTYVYHSGGYYFTNQDRAAGAAPNVSWNYIGAEIASLADLRVHDSPTDAASRVHSLSKELVVVQSGSNYVVDLRSGTYPSNTEPAHLYLEERVELEADSDEAYSRWTLESDLGYANRDGTGTLEFLNDEVMPAGTYILDLPVSNVGTLDPSFRGYRVELSVGVDTLLERTLQVGANRIQFTLYEDIVCPWSFKVFWKNDRDVSAQGYSRQLAVRGYTFTRQVNELYAVGIESGTLSIQEVDVTLTGTEGRVAGNPNQVTVPGGWLATLNSYGSVPSTGWSHESQLTGESSGLPRNRLRTPSTPARSEDIILTPWFNDTVVRTAYCSDNPSGPPFGDPAQGTVPAGEVWSFESKANADARASNLALQRARCGLSCKWGNDYTSVDVVCCGTVSGTMTGTVAANTYLHPIKDEANSLALVAANLAAEAQCS